MFIREITLENHKILWDISLSFLNEKGKLLDTVIFVWENWAWKSTLIDVIFQFSNFGVLNQWNENEKRIFEIQFSDLEMDIINKYKTTIWIPWTTEFSNKFTISYDLNIIGNWNQVSITNWDSNIKVTTSLFQQAETKSLLKSLFSDVSINFSPKDIKNTTNTDTDSDIRTSLKSSENLSTEITQMLVDIRTKDNEEQVSWENENKKLAPLSKREIRTRRFKKAFNIIFKNKLKYHWVDNLIPIFKKSDKTVKIGELSSGEKQIVFRGSFLLKDKESVKWAMVLIDEPEISLHPNWQENILDFYKKLFTSDKWEQTSQIFITTHSPYILEKCNFENTWLYIFPNWKKIKELPIYSWKYPSLSTINYFVYKIFSVEFHIELYNYLKSKKWENKGIKKFDEDFFQWSDVWLSPIYPWYTTPNTVTLHTHIRNVIHHWDSIKEPDFKKLLVKSIKEMIKLANNIT